MDYTENINRTKTYIENNLTEELSVDKIAYDMGYSTYHFCRIFKAYTGVSLMKYVREKRLERAKTEIRQGATAASAAIDCGFETASGFSRAYKRTYGHRPASEN